MLTRYFYSVLSRQMGSNLTASLDSLKRRSQMDYLLIKLWKGMGYSFNPPIRQLWSSIHSKLPTS